MEGMLGYVFLVRGLPTGQETWTAMVVLSGAISVSDGIRNHRCFIDGPTYDHWDKGSCHLLNLGNRRNTHLRSGVATQKQITPFGSQGSPSRLCLIVVSRGFKKSSSISISVLVPLDLNSGTKVLLSTTGNNTYIPPPSICSLLN
jgi:hypothetical protein